MTTRRSYDSDALRAVARKIGGLSGPLGDTGNGVSVGSGGTPFGDLPSSAGISSALKSFTDGVRKEFEAGAVAGDMDENVRSFQPKGAGRAV